uniref:Uncharacterized protein n=1 Tax=Branchiostoma floridae TaxID=7739 RepID=C3ZR74_BRAFL|eukprot:XP_002588936.1 hypothetical protein BRAFLDRAFT_89125 [Branchiostoma floridae]
MAEQAGEAGQAAAQPVIEMMAEWGRVYLRITDVWTVRALAIGAFYLANRYLTMRAVRRAVERRDPDNPDQPADPQVGLEAEVDSLLVPVIFYSQLGYQYFTSILNGPFLKACLQAELAKVGYEAPIDVSAEKWELPNLSEGGAGPLMGMMRVQDWLAELQISEKALQLPYGHSRQQAINHVIDIVLQHGETDPMYKHLASIYFALGLTIWETTRQPAPALSAYASALMHKSDHLPTMYLTAVCSLDVSVPQAIRQFHHYIHTAPTDHQWVPYAHYLLVTLYGQQDPSVHRDRILHHYNMAQQADRNRLPVFNPVPGWITDPARRVYEQVMTQPYK